MIGKQPLARRIPYGLGNLCVDLGVSWMKIMPWSGVQGLMNLFVIVVVVWSGGWTVLDF